MISAAALTPNQANTILFVLVDANGDLVTGLGSGFTLQLSKSGAVFQSGLGVKSEIGSGWYKAVITAAESDTIGPIAVKITHANITQQNMEYCVGSRVSNGIPFTYTVTSTEGGNPPIEGVNVSIYTDSGATNFVWAGRTDSFGVLRDEAGDLPILQAGVYFFLRRKDGYEFDGLDQESVS